MIVLIGFMGSGKTTVARMLAARLGLPYVDTDAEIERSENRSIADIFSTDGEDRFRAIERQVVTRILEGAGAVVSLGGGAVTDPATRALLSAHDTVFLDVTLEEALRRVGGDTAARPLLLERDPAELYTERRPVYSTVARVTVDTTTRRPDEVAADIFTRIEPPRGPDADGVRIVRVGAGATYPVAIGAGISARLGTYVSIPETAEKAFLITHPALAAHAEPVVGALEAAGLVVEVLEIIEGEASKSLGSVAELYSRLADRSAHRGDLVVTLGGGVVGDVGGFVASTYMRGLPLVNVPSTLLAQVDAGVGGKTGVNLEPGKNLVGTIYQPRGVVCDVDLLKSCPPEEIRSGLAEVVKYGLIADPTLLELIVADPAPILELDRGRMVEVVARSVRVKASIVSTDEHERGDRAFLNYGHTFAHAIESVTGLGGIRHGEAVALGMMAAAYTAAELGRIDAGLVDLHRAVLSSVGLPVAGKFNYDDLAGAWNQDKKYDRGARFVLLRGLGMPEAGVAVEPDVLRTALARLARED